MKLSLYYPAKPFIISQAWGIYNPAYLQFGYSKHSGVDFLAGFGKLVRAPIEMEVMETGFTESKGNFARLISTKKWEIGGIECYLGLILLHAEKVLCIRGQILKVGEEILTADNTGFSTGEHTHGGFYRLSKRENLPKYRLDTDKETDYTLDPSPYWNGYYAEDSGKVSMILAGLIKLLQQLAKQKVKKNR